MELRLVLLAHIVGICSGLREVRMQTPTAVEKGSSAVLNCWYELEGANLYTVKWYKGEGEFYRYTPNESPPAKTFSIGNLKVNLAESNATQVSLMELDFDAAGEYRCEVSEDEPTFHTAIVAKTLNVVELPSQRPTIHGLQRKYQIGDTLKLNCTSGKSRPPANLTWYVNDRQPLGQHVRLYNPSDTNEADWEVSKIGLQFLVNHEHFAAGKLKIRCSASIYDIYWQSIEVSTEEDRPRVIQLEPAATIVGVNYLQPPPNFQTGQRKPDGHLDVKDLDSSGGGAKLPESPMGLILGFLLILRLAIN